MKIFTSVAEAFNHYRTAPIEDMEKRAAEIKTAIATDPAADIAAFNIELEGIREAKENALEKMEQRRGVQPFNPITGMSFGNQQGTTEITRDNVFKSAEYRAAFAKIFSGKQVSPVEKAAFDFGQSIINAEKRADDFASSGNTPAVLPTALYNEVISKARTQGGLIAICRDFGGVPSRLAIPIATPRPRAEKHTEGATVERKRPIITNVTFDGYEILEVFSISSKIRHMSIEAFESYLVKELVACVMETVEYWLVDGNGNEEGTGLNTITWGAGNSIQYAAGTTPKYADFTSTIALLKRGYSAGAHWAMNNATLYTHVYGVVDDNKRPIFIADPQKEQVGHILGKPVCIDDNIADGEIFLGNFQYMGFNFVEVPIVEMSGSSGFREKLVDYRASATADTKPIVAEAFVKLMEE